VSRRAWSGRETAVSVLHQHAVIGDLKERELERPMIPRQFREPFVAFHGLAHHFLLSLLGVALKGSSL
jgi:hypothetical protein